jgi:hypothetical protein
MKLTIHICLVLRLILLRGRHMDNFNFTSDFINKPMVEVECLAILLRLWEVESSWDVMAHNDARGWGK